MHLKLKQITQQISQKYIYRPQNVGMCRYMRRLSRKYKIWPFSEQKEKWKKVDTGSIVESIRKFLNDLGYHRNL